MNEKRKEEKKRKQVPRSLTAKRNRSRRKPKKSPAKKRRLHASQRSRPALAFRFLPTFYSTYILTPQHQLPVQVQVMIEKTAIEGK